MTSFGRGVWPVRGPVQGLPGDRRAQDRAGRSAGIAVLPGDLGQPSLQEPSLRPRGLGEIALQGVESRLEQRRQLAEPGLDQRAWVNHVGHASQLGTRFTRSCESSGRHIDRLLARHSGASVDVRARRRSARQKGSVDRCRTSQSDTVLSGLAPFLAPRGGVVDPLSRREAADEPRRCEAPQR